MEARAQKTSDKEIAPLPGRWISYELRGLAEDCSEEGGFFLSGEERILRLCLLGFGH